MDKETLEEAAKGYSERHQDVSGNLGKYLVSAVFQDGANWQQERMYSEEEVERLCMSAYNQATKDGSEAWLGTFDKWFEQNKKK